MNPWMTSASSGFAKRTESATDGAYYRRPSRKRHRESATRMRWRKGLVVVDMSNSSLELVAHSSPRLSRLVALGYCNADAKAIYVKPGTRLRNKGTIRSAMGHLTRRGAETRGRRATLRSLGGLLHGNRESLPLAGWPRRAGRALPARDLFRRCHRLRCAARRRAARA
jgi:hypothetical protein